MNYLLMLVWIGLLRLYYPLNRRPNCSYLRYKIDDYIPLIPIFVIPYIFFFVWTFLPAIIMWNNPLGIPFLASQVIATLTGTFVWWKLPTGVKRPSRLEELSIFHRMLNTIYSHDSDVNACPSGHVYTSLISSYYLALFIPYLTVPIYLIGILISISTVFTKQHYFVDLIGGSIWAVLSVMLGQYIVHIL